jgi:DNA-binding transcriptional LysR family regulator
MTSTSAAELGIELRHLRYFLAVAEHRHFTRAAERLHIAQPPLSAQIRQLEERVGSRLFDRVPGRVTITPAGEALIPAARTALAALERGVAAVQGVAAGEQGAVRVAVGDAVALEPVLRAVKRLAHEAPGLRVEPAAVADPLRSVRDGEADLALLHGPVAADGLTTVTLPGEARVVLVAVDDALARRPAIALGELPRDRLLEVGQGAPAGAVPLARALAEVAAGRAVAIVPAGAATTAAAEIRAIPLTGETATTRVAVHRPGDPAAARVAAALTVTTRSSLALRLAHAA